MSKERELQLLGMYEPELARSLQDARLSEARLREIRRAFQRRYDELAQERRRFDTRAADATRTFQEVRDLRHHLRDRDAHIRNLEAQLRPLLVNAGDDPGTEPML